jgi:hypothetical protein
MLAVPASAGSMGMDFKGKRLGLCDTWRRNKKAEALMQALRRHVAWQIRPGVRLLPLLFQLDIA